MRNGSPEDEANARRRAELCALADGRDTGTGRDADVADADPTDRLGELGDALLAAYQLAEQDGDPLTVALLEQALLRTGRRLARGMSPADVGIACH
ncbi:hypothetical protein [Methylobacterium radiotolerans]|uniref:Uncharacterized protein n=1 Tax=Methylobacterium radiotolerans (strain ATCC 27329 / DSM 1819 / JCM 2831 / NBRC 15690 / NCIMB 10815 / 0-1) TaxID=426355 RepID=B1LVT1_METRJ|nr:hypothetical protein [Methylobacterium radiotolerans]ACB25581.1 hypothetical protein Mrad2831_3605 [Methylobacterium radiotolerans JCM 2831]KTS05958.1 hypothetical protein SB3_21070 [Methylobacterium radiotolerans]KTS46697.1 hypothetical protein SB2_16220 [Methylobacterium radiotolerans]KZC01228.1 hypothetical protein AU375_02513 [Methylobacterium radiotolerans]UIY40454.1 hypothetical protein LZ599_18690 [Methylobacterium radiotolerans]